MNVKRLTLAGLLAILLVPTLHVVSCGGDSVSELCDKCDDGDFNACEKLGDNFDKCGFDDTDI